MWGGGEGGREGAEEETTFHISTYFSYMILLNGCRVCHRVAEPLFNLSSTDGVIAGSLLLHIVLQCISLFMCLRVYFVSSVNS